MGADVARSNSRRDSSHEHSTSHAYEHRPRFGSRATIAAERKTFVFRYKSPAHWVETFRDYYGPVHKAFAIDPQAREALEADLYALISRFNIAGDGTLVVPGEYLETVITKRG